MSNNLIDSSDGIDISKLTFSDIQIKNGTGRSTLKSGSVRKKSAAYRFGYQTNIGNIKTDVWVNLAEQLIRREDEKNILERLIKHVKSLAWMKRESESRIREYALELHTARIFDNPAWVGFIPFNESWRQKVLETVEIVDIIPNCCQKAGRVTINQIKNIDNNRVYCPHCGRSAAFKRIY